MAYYITLHKLGAAAASWNKARRANEEPADNPADRPYRVRRRITSNYVRLRLRAARTAITEATENGQLTYDLALRAFRDGQDSREKF